MFLLNVDTEDVTPVGSCVLVQIGHEHFLPTAAHATDQAVNDYVIVIPVERRLAEIQGHFAQLGRLGERDDKACSLDISYFHLDRQFADRIRPDYFPILGDAVHNLDAAAPGDLYSIAGYPEDITTVTADVCSSELFALTGDAAEERFYRKLKCRSDMHLL